MFPVMRNVVVAPLLLLLPVLSTCAAPAFSTEDIYGSWRVAQVICVGCSGPVLALDNKIIEIGRQRIVNPAGDECQMSPGMDLLQERTSSEVLAGGGAAWPRAVRDAVAAHRRVLFGFITCGGINYMQILFVSRDAGFYFLEGNTALALTRFSK
jgi:hypothetical protein